eukprot:1613327-Amphidinium_carterae.1
MGMRLSRHGCVEAASYFMPTRCLANPKTLDACLTMPWPCCPSRCGETEGRWRLACFQECTCVCSTWSVFLEPLSQVARCTVESSVLAASVLDVAVALALHPYVCL